MEPQQIAGILCEHPWVADACVRLMRPEEGSRLKAFVVPSAQAPLPPALSAGLAAWIVERLTPAQRPVSLRFGERLPRGRLGKTADWDA